MDGYLVIRVFVILNSVDKLTAPELDDEVYSAKCPGLLFKKKCSPAFDST